MNNDTIFSAYITNLGKYNEGELIGEWVSFPTTNKIIKAVFASIGIDFVNYEEYFIADYESEIGGLTDCLGEYESITELNYLAAKIQDLGEEQEYFEAALEVGEHTRSLKELINLTENMDCFDYMHGIDCDYDLGYYWIVESGAYDTSNFGSLSNYIDYEAFGRDIRIEEGGIYANSGYICLNNASFTEIYSGSKYDIPKAYWICPKRKEGNRE